MALRPPKDFASPSRERASPSQSELRALWERHEVARQKRERLAHWRRAQQHLRRDHDGELHLAYSADRPSADLYGEDTFGPHARAALRPLPREGRVLAAGIDTWSPCWYAEPGSPLARAMRALARVETAGRACLLPEPLAGHRVGWFPEPGLVFAEGRAGGEALCSAAGLPVAATRLDRALGDIGIPVAAVPSAGLRRLDVAADICTDSAAEGLALLECVAASSPGVGKLAVYRAGRCVESVLIKSRAGRTLARFYDKGAQADHAPRGRWLRFEAQWRFAREARPSLAALDQALLRERFARRFAPLWQAAGGFALGGLEAVGGGSTRRFAADSSSPPALVRSSATSSCAAPASPRAPVAP